MLQTGKEAPAHCQGERLAGGQLVSLGGQKETSAALPRGNEEMAEEKVPLTSIFFPCIRRLTYLPDLPLWVSGTFMSLGEQSTKEAK